MSELLARVGLSRSAEPGHRGVHEAVRRIGAAAVWEALREGAPLPGLSRTTVEGMSLRARGAEPGRDLERLHAAGGRVLLPGDPEWPALDWSLPDVEPPPLLLYVRGRPALHEASDRSVAVVGARAATAYGHHVAAQLALELAEAGWGVVSGGAYGIDASAHRGALSARGAAAGSAAAGATVAVLACGVDVAYPRGHDRLLAQVAEQGLVVSELPPGEHPTRTRFLVRNRVIAALARGTVVVEAALRSGSLSTAGRARSLGRHVMALPGPVTSPMSAGCHELLRASATCVTSAEQVLELVAPAGEHLLAPARGPSSVRDGLDGVVRQVLEAVPVRVPRGEAGIARQAGVSAVVVTQVLPSLLVAGLVERTDEGWRLTALGAGR